MKIGAIVRTSERGGADQPRRFSDIKELALTAEAVGFDSFWLPDHLIYRPHEADELGCWEVFTFLGALASVTTTLTLGTLVASSLFRNPALLAKMADSLDEISGGRFILVSARGTGRRNTACSGSHSITTSVASRRRCRSSPPCCMKVRSISKAGITRRTGVSSARAGRP